MYIPEDFFYLDSYSAHYEIIELRIYRYVLYVKSYNTFTGCVSIHNDVLILVRHRFC